MRVAASIVLNIFGIMKLHFVMQAILKTNTNEAPNGALWIGTLKEFFHLIPLSWSCFIIRRFIEIVVEIQLLNIQAQSYIILK